MLGEQWATTSLNNISSAQYTFDQLVMALNESINLERETEKAGTFSKKLERQFMTHPNDVRKYYHQR